MLLHYAGHVKSNTRALQVLAELPSPGSGVRRPALLCWLGVGQFPPGFLTALCQAWRADLSQRLELRAQTVRTAHCAVCRMMLSATLAVLVAVCRAEFWSREFSPARPPNPGNIQPPRNAQQMHNNLFGRV